MKKLLVVLAGLVLAVVFVWLLIDGAEVTMDWWQGIRRR